MSLREKNVPQKTLNRGTVSTPFNIMHDTSGYKLNIEEDMPVQSQRQVGNLSLYQNQIIFKILLFSHSSQRKEFLQSYSGLSLKMCPQRKPEMNSFASTQHKVEVPPVLSNVIIYSFKMFSARPAKMCFSIKSLKNKLLNSGTLNRSPLQNETIC